MQIPRQRRRSWRFHRDQ